MPPASRVAIHSQIWETQSVHARLQLARVGSGALREALVDDIRLDLRFAGGTQPVRWAGAHRTADVVPSHAGA
jgi:hypothetical protein